MSNKSVQALSKGYIPLAVHTIIDKNSPEEKCFAYACKYHRITDAKRYGSTINYPYKGLEWLQQSLIPEYKHELNMTKAEINVT